MRSDPPDAQDSAWRAEIVSLEYDANQAFLERDLERLDQLFSDELVVNSPINMVHDKKKLLELLGKGIIGHVSSTIQHELIRKDGDVIIVMGSDAVRNAPSEPMLRRRFTNIWRKECGGWKLYVRHANVIGADTAPKPPRPAA
jgi:ketosteroid isomerase-like protein